MDDPVICDVADRIATITLNRPEVRNALDSATRRLLPELVRRADEDDAVDVMILTGADPAFCAGLDLKELGSAGADIGAGQANWRGPLPPRSKPLIGAINGPAITGGLELALSCDFLVASDRARFADTHARVGIHPGWGLTTLLPQAVGVRRARELSATGLLIDAGTALTWGLVNHVVDHARLLDFCRELASAISGADQEALRHLFVTYDAITSDDPGWATEREQAAAWMGKRAFDPDTVAERRDAIIQGGRDQL